MTRHRRGTICRVEHPPFSQIPWTAPIQQWKAEASRIEQGGACCLFLIDDSIPAYARAGYAALVIAYARANEPVTIFQDGAAALLIREGGPSAGEVAARRIITQMQKLGLEKSLRAGICGLGGDPQQVLDTARELAVAAEPGQSKLG